MPDALLSTKLHIPRPHPALVSRPRLTARLEAGLRGRLTLVSAPAGYGKTTLLSDWIYRRGTDASSAVVPPAGASTAPLQVAWLSLDASDNDPARFLSYLIAALQGIDAGIGAELQAIVGGAQAPLEGLLTRLVHEIEAATENSDRRTFVLVLDDYHVITAPAVHEALRFLLDHLPPAMHLLIASRTDPPLPTSRLRVQGEVTEIRSAELRFTTEEAAALLNDRMGLGLSPADVAALDARTEGWVASLQLAAMSLRGRLDKRAFIAAFSGSHRYVLDYLMDEVMTRQPPEVRAFLRQTSILDRFCAPLCDAVCTVCGSEGAASRDILRQLEGDNLFLIPLDDERRWYRYHHLFADFLGQCLREQEPGSISELHRRASQWYEAEGAVDAAIEHALAAGDSKRATRLVDQIAAALIVRRNPNALLKWVDRLPPDYCQGYPMLCVWHAWALLFSGQLDAVEPILQMVKVNRGQVPYLPLLGYTTTVRAYLANQMGDLPRALALSHQALDQMADAPPEQTTLIFRGASVIWLAVNYRHLGELVRARELFIEATSLNEKAGNYYAALASKEQLGDMAMVQGQLHRAAETYRQGLQMAQAWSDLEDRGAGPLLAEGGPRLGLGTVLYQWNDLAGAARHLERALELGEWGETWSRMYGFRLLAYVKQAEGDDKAAVELLQRACAIRDTISVRQQNVTEEPGLVQLRILLSRRQPEMAHLITDLAHRIEEQGLQANSASSIDFTSPASFRLESKYADLARALIALDRAGEALPLLDRLLSAARSMGRWGDAIRYLAQQALAFHALGDTPSALACLGRALSQAEPEGYVRLFVDEGEPMKELLQAVRQGQQQSSSISGACHPERSVAQPKGLLAHQRGSSTALRSAQNDNYATVPAVSQAYVDKLLAAFGTEAKDRTSVGRPLSPTQTWGVESLSARELEVLRLMAQGKKYAQVAEQLVISMNTVRHHTRNIFGKLDVHSRAQAIVRARELDLL